MKETDLIFSEDIYVEIMADSVRPTGDRLTTWLMQIPNIIHAEMLRHRMFSFSVSSNRAIPINKLNSKDIFIPNSVGYNESGMSAMVPLTSADLYHYQMLWQRAHEAMLYIQAQAEPIRVHKQHANRLTMPFQNVTMVVTTPRNGLMNFFNLRNSEMAQPEIHEVAIKMMDLYYDSVPTRLEYGDWHIPFILPSEQSLPLYQRALVSSARCARTSYRLNVEQVYSDFESDYTLAKKLFRSKHYSPFEHIAMAFDPYILEKYIYENNLNKDFEAIYNLFNNTYRNTKGWKQLRVVVEQCKTLEELQGLL